MVGLGTEF